MQISMTFWKKTCKNCRRKIEKGFSYCPHCGTSLINREKEEENYGFLGKKDIRDLEDFNLFGRERSELRLPFGFNTVFKKLIKEMDKQFKELDKELGKEKIRKTNIERPFIRKGGISINISSGEGRPVIKVRSFGNLPEFREMESQIKQPIEKTIKTKSKIKPTISEEKAKKLAKLPREEAESKVRRLSGKVIYEIELPEVKSIKDIIVNQLENSIEIKAFSKDKAYFKFLPVSLPLLSYKFSKGKLILELGEK